MIAEAALAGATKGFVGTLGNLAASHAARTLVTGPEKIEKIKTNLTPHIEATFRRCASIKTLLNPHDPVDLLSIHTTQRFSNNGKPIDHYSLVEIVKRHKNNIIVTGTGGSGKSMFMRYLWLSLFENSDGRVPIYVELRSMNTLSSVNIEQYLHYTLTQGRGSISEANFRKNLSAGDFIVILDGFDELSSEKKEAVQAAIMDLAANYADLKIILSSRPDDTFASWPSFSVYKVCPLERRDVLELVEKAQFDPSAKARFSRKIKEDGLFEKHRSFLSNPLLACMMLLTFSYNYDIPEKMHLFYDQAFDALYQRHDTHKPGGYKREFHAKLSEDSFKRLLSYFCLISYYNQKFEFDREEILDVIRSAVKVYGDKVDANHFLSDLTKSVCLIVLDGQKYTFAHRSFQEYFAAYCLAYVTSKNLESLVSKFSARPKDQAVQLLADMNPELFRERYLIPISEQYESELQIKRKEKSVHEFMRHVEGSFQIFMPGPKDADMFFGFSGRGDLCNFYDLLGKLIGKPAEGLRSRKVRKDGDVQAAKDLRRVIGDAGVKQILVLGDESGFKYVINSSGSEKDKVVRESEALDAIFRNSPMHDFIVKRLGDISNFVTTQRKKTNKSSDVMKEIFDL